MRTCVPLKTLTPFLPWLMALASCSSPPRPPTVDESQKRPVNTPMAVELQVCKSDLQNTRLLATESGRLAEATAATLANLAARQQTLAALQAQANSVYTVHFEYGSVRVVLSPEGRAELIEDAKASPLVLLRGRTDGTSDAPAESRIARERATAVRDHLVAAGVDPMRIRITYQPSGDPVADNATAKGRGLNRRVEIELYRVRPVAIGASDSAQP
jgi:outer membrane protein OmpA-like peptidoglycan-associated protein